jgi:hypothetical protein
VLRSGPPFSPKGKGAMAKISFADVHPLVGDGTTPRPDITKQDAPVTNSVTKQDAPVMKPVTKGLTSAPSVTKLGRPPKGEAAMSPAERQRAYRARKRQNRKDHEP